MQPTIDFDNQATIQRKFEEFHAAHPEVYDRLCHYARQVKRQKTKYGLAALWERVRWHFTFEAEAGAFKANNNFRSRYDRLIMEQEPDLAGFFETRELRSE